MANIRLGKRPLYDLAVFYLDYDLPVCSQCSYTCRKGYEWLTFTVGDSYVKFSVLNGGVWIKVTEQDDLGTIIRSEVLKRISF